MCGCTKGNLTTWKQALSSTIAIYLVCMLSLVPSLMGDDLVDPSNGTAPTAPAPGEPTRPGLTVEMYNALTYNSVWAPLTIIFIWDGRVGGTMYIAFLRFVGTGR